MSKPQLITMKSHRKVALHRVAEGDDTRTIVLCHIAPGAGNFDPNPEETAKRSVNLLALDRPGYGDSRPVKKNEWSTVAQAADDLAEVLERLKINQVGVAGWSAGGRVALALAARHPNLVERVAIIGTPAPDEAVPWIPPPFKQALDAMRDLAPAQVHNQLGAQLDGMLAQATDLESRLTLLGRSPADDEALTFAGAKERLGAMLDAAFKQGSAGMALDIAGYTLQPWGFEPAQVKAKILCLYASKDEIGSKHGSWWQKNLPNARLEMVPGAGHLLIIPMWQRVLSFLAPNRK